MHALQELDNDLGGRLDQDLTLATLLGVDNSVQAISEHGNFNHFVWRVRGPLSLIDFIWRGRKLVDVDDDVDGIEDGWW